jgi:hypothetical protein
MISGIVELYKYRMTYCSLRVLYDECKWWEFKKRKVIKEQLYSFIR